MRLLWKLPKFYRSWPAPFPKWAPTRLRISNITVAVPQESQTNRSVTRSRLPQVNFRVGRGWGFQPQRLKNCGWKPQPQDVSQPESQAALDY
jgi:hypothetical protein